MKRASVVYRRGTLLWFRSLAETVEGLWIQSDPVLSLSVSATVEQIGISVRKVLAESVIGVPHPREWKDLPDSLLEAAGVKSWNAFERNAVSCTIEDDGKRLVFLPTRNLGAGKGYDYKEDHQVQVSSHSSYPEIGGAVLQALAACD